MRLAIAHDELFLALQPIVSLESGQPVYSEALIRWRRGEQIHQPRDFIPLAERAGLIAAIGDWTIERAAQLTPGAPGNGVMVNLSVPSSARLCSFDDFSSS